MNGERLAVPTLASLRVGGAGGRDLGLDEGTLPPSSYVTIQRAWKAGDVIELTIPKTLRLEPTPDDRTVAAIMWGPLVLAGDLGPRNERSERATHEAGPALVAGNRDVSEWVQPTGARPGDFRVVGVARELSSPKDAPGDLPLTPFYRTHGRTYSVYHDVLSEPEFEARVAGRAAETARLQRLESATVAFIRPGLPADEQTYNYRSVPADRPVTHTEERTGRGGAGTFSFDLPVDVSTTRSLIVTYHNDLGLPVLANFDIEVDGSVLARYLPNRSATGFWDATYALSPSTLGGKSRITVRFAATPGSRIAPVYGIRIIRASAS